jgi:YesN/AraC family two-component response regulator
MTCILIADDHDVLRTGLRALIETRPGWQVVAEARDGLEALRAAEATKPDIAVLDYAMPVMTGSRWPGNSGPGPHGPRS